MARTSFPDGIDSAAMTTRDPRRLIALRFLVFALVIGLAAAGLLGGGGATSRSSENAEATFLVTSHERLRNGNLFEIRFTVAAQKTITDAVIAVPVRLLREATVNALVPAPAKERSEDGEYRFRFGRLESGDVFRFKLDGQLNPMLVGRVDGHYRLLDGEREIARLPAKLEVLP